MIAPSNFTLNQLKFDWNEDQQCFYHNIGCDFQLFVVWNNALNKIDEIKEILKDRFEIHASYKIQWSDKNIYNNYRRLYRLKEENAGKKEAKQRGKGPFQIFILKDHKPKYLYHTTFSGKIDIVNKNIVELKETLRIKLNGNYVHSSNNIKEFYRDAVLFLDFEELTSILKNKKTEEVKEINRDLSGASSWNSLSSLFKSMNFALNYVVIRSFENIPYDFEDYSKDIDLLVKDVDEYLFFTNFKRPRINKSGGFMSRVRINEKTALLDISFVEDRLFDSIWQQKILDNATIKNDVLIPRIDDHFFSLLYTIKVYKKELKEKHIDVILKLSNKIGLNITKNELLNDEFIVKLISNYFVSNNFKITRPKKKGQYINNIFINKIKANPRYKNMIRIENRNKLILRFEKFPFGFKAFNIIHSTIKSLKSKLKRGR